SPFSFANPSISISMVHVPSGKSGRAYVPIRSVMATNFFSPCDAVTVAPGTGTPPKTTWPRVSADAEAVKNKQKHNTQHEPDKRRMLVIRWLLLDVIDEKTWIRTLLHFQLQSELFIDGIEKRKRAIGFRRCQVAVLLSAFSTTGSVILQQSDG